MILVSLMKRELKMGNAEYHDLLMKTRNPDYTPTPQEEFRYYVYQHDIDAVREALEDWYKQPDESDLELAEGISKQAEQSYRKYDDYGDGFSQEENRDRKSV